MQKPLSRFKVGESGEVISLACTGALRRRIIDMGLTPGAKVTLRKMAPFGDPIEINVRGYELGIRKAEADLILMRTAVPANRRRSV